jgi:DNA polymerase III subunit beta
MQFLIDRDNWIEALAKLAGIIDAKAGVPILHNILLDVRGSVVFMLATDIDLVLSMPCAAEVTEAGQITVDGRLLHDIVRKCPKGGQISVAIGGKPKRRKPGAEDAARLRLTCGAAEFVLHTLSAEDWPLIELSPGAAEFRLECRQLRALIEKTRFAISSDPFRYYLGGIYLHALGENLAAVATDGHRLSVKTVPLPAGARRDGENPGPRTAVDGLAAYPGVILPKDAAAAALKILPDSEVECELAVSASLLRLRIGEVELLSKLIDGTYPDWQRVVPKAGASRIIVPREALAKAVSRVSVVLDDGSPIAVCFDPERITLNARSVAAGHEARELVEDCAGDIAGIAVGCNAKYLAELLDALGGSQIAIMLQEDPIGAPILFEEVDGDGSLRMVLMPMRLPGEKETPAPNSKQTAAAREMEAA